MTIISSIDPSTSPRRIYLHADTVGVDFQPMDAYREMRALRASDETLRPYDVFITSQGNESTGPSSSTPRRIRMENSVFVPFNTDHNLRVIGEIITSAGGSGTDAFDRTPLSPGTDVDIDYIPPQVEIITVNTGGGSGSITQQDIDAITAQVWTEATRTLTSAAGVTAQDILDIADAVWVANNRTVDTAFSNTSSLTQEQSDQLKELWQVEGLDANNPMTATKTSRVVASIVQIYTGDRRTTTTATRQ